MSRLLHFGVGLGWLLCFPAWHPAAAQQLVLTVEIERRHLGSGEPEQSGFENATVVSNDTYHAPQYMPGHPTAHVLWARVIDVPCTQVAPGRLQCKGYPWSPAIGRAEYLYFRPVLTAEPTANLPDPLDLSSSSSLGSR